jgi:hypothetical protein
MRPRTVPRRIWDWLTLANVSRVADLAAKLAAIILAFAAIDFFSAKPNVQIAQMRCRSAVDLPVLGQVFRTFGGSTLPRIRAFAARFPAEPHSVFSSGIRGATDVAGDATVANCRPLFRPIESLSKSDRDVVKSYFLAENAIPRDVYYAATKFRQQKCCTYHSPDATPVEIRHDWLGSHDRARERRPAPVALADRKRKGGINGG